MAVTLSGEGRGNGKKPAWVWGALLRKGAKGMRDGIKISTPLRAHPQMECTATIY